MSNNISFKSKINFVSLQEFKRVTAQNSNFISYGAGKIPYLQADNFYAEFVRTCSAGGITDSKTASLGFHILDCFSNFANMDNICSKMFESLKLNNLRALIIGGKAMYSRPYSMKDFEKIRDNFLQKMQNISIFQGHTQKMAETHCHYDLKNDTWTICSMYEPENTHRLICIRSMGQLKNAFEKIKIADGDKLYFEGRYYKLQKPEIK